MKVLKAVEEVNESQKSILFKNFQPIMEEL